METEKEILELIATDRIGIPISSMSGKLKRREPKLASEIDLEGESKYLGERCYGRIEQVDLNKARGLRAGVDEFAKRYPSYGKILNGLIEKERKEREEHLYFGMNPGCKLTEGDYMGVMKNLGFTETTSRSLYPELMTVSRNLSKKRDEERSILIA